MKELYAKLEKIERETKRGYITISEANKLMMEEIDKSITNFYNDEYAPTIDSMKAYHKMYMILANLTKAGRF